MPLPEASPANPSQPKPSLRIAIVGDYNPEVTAHRAIPEALRISASTLDAEVELMWLPTPSVAQDSSVLGACHGVWLTPGSPYASMDGAIEAARYARENNAPFLGTCGGFQHALIEFARNVAGVMDAEHAETAPLAPALVVNRLSCSLVNVEGRVHFAPSTLIGRSYRRGFATEEYQCNYGLNPLYRKELEAAGLRFTATDDEGDIRAFELPSNRFYVGALFQPERAALRGEAPPLARSFLEAVLARMSEETI